MLNIKYAATLVATVLAASVHAGCGVQNVYIGVASINEEGVISLDLWPSEQTHSGAMLLLDKKHPLYKEVLKHVGKLEVGKEKPVKPWCNGKKRRSVEQKFFTPDRVLSPEEAARLPDDPKISPGK
ncbi:hypothetical protein [Chitinimonas naiadis]